MDPLAYSMKDAALASGKTSTRNLYSYAKRGLLKLTRVGGRTVILKDELERFLRSDPPAIDQPKKSPRGK